MKIANTLLIFLVSCLIAHSAEIDRKTFSLSLPDKWTEDTKDDMYSPDSFVFFEGPESVFTLVMIGKKTAGASLDIMLSSQKDSFNSKLTDTTITNITKWADTKGKGYQMEGKIQGIFRVQITIFGFEKGNNACVIVEYASIGDLKKYSKDFEKIRKSFRLK